VTVRVPASGVIDIWNMFGSVDVVADVVGYYNTNKTTEAGRFVALDPFRSFDSRATGALWPETGVVLRAADPRGVPETGVASLVINLTAVTPTGAGYLSVFPSDVSTIPTVSTLNFTAGQVVANQAIANLSTFDGVFPRGSYVVFYAYNFVYVVVDVSGYFT